jgi:hypothetical protein
MAIRCRTSADISRRTTELGHASQAPAQLKPLPVRAASPPLFDLGASVLLA